MTPLSINDAVIQLLCFARLLGAPLRRGQNAARELPVLDQAPTSSTSKPSPFSR